MKYTNEIKEFARVRMEQTPSDTQIARDIVNKFELDKTVDAVRKWVCSRRDKLAAIARARPVKRLFFDIETGYYILKIRAWQLKNFVKYFDPDSIEQEKEILCISYKWQGEDKVHTLDYRNGEKKMLKEFIKIMGQADEIVAHNGDRFDIRFLRTRCFYHGVLMFPDYRTLDTLKNTRSGFLFASNKLDYLCKLSGVGGKKEHDGMSLWIDIVEGKDMDRLDQMVAYCERDVVMLEDFFFIISPFIKHNTNFAVLKGGEKWHCPECASHDVVMHNTYTTPLGVIRRQMKCNDCKKQYKVSNKTYMSMLEYLHKN